MERLLIVPAAGLGSRLGGSVPKLLASVGGRAMLDHLLELHSGVDRVALVVHPTAEAAVRARTGGAVDLFVQHEPTGMLDAIMLARPAVEAQQPRRVCITWCDQIGIHPRTIRRLAELTAPPSDPALALPTCRRCHPYIHFERGPDGAVRRVLQRREGDAMPEVGESDAGLFDLSHGAYLGSLAEYATTVAPGDGTGERNFLPFVPWLSSRASVVTFPCVDQEEAIGVNTPEELRLVERYLRERAQRAT